MFIKTKITLADKILNSTESGICPRCGGILTEKLGKFGKFLGCDKFPKCRFAINFKTTEKLKKLSQKYF